VWAKAFAVLTAKRLGGQGQKHLLPEHVFELKTTSLIITDFSLRRGNRVLRSLTIRPDRAIEEVKIVFQVIMDSLNTPRARHLKLTFVMRFKTNIRNNIAGPTMFLQQVSPANYVEVFDLFDVRPVLNLPRSYPFVKFKWFAFQFHHGDQHVQPLRAWSALATKSSQTLSLSESKESAA